MAETRRQPTTLLLTWPAYGTRLPGPRRGRIERCAATDWSIPEPDEAATEPARRSMTWPVISLSDAQRRIVRDDLARIAELREFGMMRSVIAADHVHLLLRTRAWADDQAIRRLVQLIKGATARALSVAVGDPSPRDAAGRPRTHHKWWGQQYVVQVLADAPALLHAAANLDAHPETA